MIWTIFWINVLTVAVAFKKRMVLYALLNVAFLYLVTGQAFQIEGDLERSHATVYLNNFINGPGFILALRYVLGISFVSLVLALISRGYVKDMQVASQHAFTPPRRFYFFLFALECAIGFILVFVVVGLSQFLNSSRPGYQSGATVFIVLLFLGIIPLLLKILSRSSIGSGDIVCFLFAFIVTSAFSRIHAILYLTAILIALFYERRWADMPISISMIMKIITIGCIASVVFLGIGALHDAQNFTGGSISDLINYIIAHPEKSILSFEYNYRVGVEGMSGIAGAFTQYLNEPTSVHFDYGASWILQGSVQWLPGAVKSSVSSISDYGMSLDWSPFSIVATGPESFFKSFGWFSVLLYPLGVYLLAWHLPLKILSAQASTKTRLIACIFFAITIFFTRGSLSVWIAYSVTYIAVIILFWKIYNANLVKHKSSLQSLLTPAPAPPGVNTTDKPCP